MIESVLQSSEGAWSVPDGWGQGRGVFGGLLCGALVTAARQKLTDPTRELRSLAMMFIAPPDVGAARLEVSSLREGGGSTTVEAALVQKGSVRSKALLVFSKPRLTEGAFCIASPPFDADWQKAQVIPVGPPFAPIFAQHFEYRPTLGLPFSGGTTAETAGWIRPASFSGKYDAALIATCADAYWHSLQARGETMRAALTVSYSLELYGDLEHVEPDAPLFHHGISWAMQGGYASERRTLWSASGSLLAVNHQSIAVLG